MAKIENKVILKKCLFYTSLVWLVNLVIFGLILISLNKLSIKSYFQFFSAVFLIFVLQLSVIGLFSYMIFSIKINHWLRKIFISFSSISLIFLTSYLIFKDEDFYGDKVYIIIAIAFSIPTLVSIGLFYPDKFDEELENER